jgi:hypothetical protein
MEDRLLQRALADIIIERRAGYAQEEGQLRPVLVHVADGLAQGRVRLCLVLFDLGAQPRRELLHQGSAPLLVEAQALFGRHGALPGDQASFLYTSPSVSRR